MIWCNYDTGVQANHYWCNPLPSARAIRNSASKLRDACITFQLKQLFDCAAVVIAGVCKGVQADLVRTACWDRGVYS